MTYYDSPAASNGNGGPHTLADVSQEVLDAARGALNTALEYELGTHADAISSDTRDSIADFVLAEAIAVGGLNKEKLQ